MHNSSFYFEEKVPEEGLHKMNPFILELKTIDSSGKIVKDISKEMDTAEFKNFISVSLKRNITPKIIAMGINENIKSNNSMKQNRFMDSLHENIEYIITSKINDYELISDLSNTFLQLNTTIEIYNHLSDDLIYTYNESAKLKLKRNISGMMLKSIPVIELVEIKDDDLRAALKTALSQISDNFIKSMDEIVINSNKK